LSSLTLLKLVLFRVGFRAADPLEASLVLETVVQKTLDNCLNPKP
jgi:hypothetical protein